MEPKDDIVKQVRVWNLLGKMQESSSELYAKILDTAGFAYYFNELCLLASGKPSNAFKQKVDHDFVPGVPSPDGSTVASLVSETPTQIEQEEREFLAMMFGFCSAREIVYPKAINRYDTVLNFIIKVKTDPLAMADYETFLDPKSKIRIDTQTNYWKERLEQAENMIQKMGREGEINPKNSEDYDPKKPSFTIRKEGDPEPQKPEPRVGNL